MGQGLGGNGFTEQSLGSPPDRTLGAGVPNWGNVYGLARGFCRCSFQWWKQRRVVSPLGRNRTNFETKLNRNLPGSWAPSSVRV